MKTKVLENKIVLVFDHRNLKSITEPMITGGYHKVEIVYSNFIRHNILDTSHIVKHVMRLLHYETHADALHALYACLTEMEYTRQMENDQQAMEPILFYEED